MSWAWTIVAPSVCRLGRVGKGLSMINYYAVAEEVFEHETWSGVQNARCIPRRYNLFAASSVCAKKIASRVLTVHAEVCS